MTVKNIMVTREGKMNDNLMAVVLAAGKGTRMKSDQPKVLRQILGEPMLGWTLAALRPIFGQSIIVVAGHKAQAVREAFPACKFALQERQLGTGHALMSAMEDARKEHTTSLLVINGDAPLVTTATIENFLQAAMGTDIAFASILLPDPGDYGRVWRENGEIKAIVEARDYDQAKHGPATGEVNAGMYLITTACADRLLPRLQNNNASGEFYLTDLIVLAAAAGMNIKAVECGNDPALLGVNSPLELAAAEEILAARITGELLEEGVVVHGRQYLRAGPRAIIEPGCEITAPCEIYGDCHIEEGAVIESHCWIRDSHIGKNAQVHSFSHLDGAVVGESAQVGPYARLRPGARLGKHSRVGNFVELKKTSLGTGAKASHLSYLGDADIGANVNIGAGTITCNYDGKAKHKTTIGADAFIGSNTALVAPVNVGQGALVGAGSVITEDVPDGDLAIARQKQKNLPRRRS